MPADLTPPPFRVATSGTCARRSAPGPNQGLSTGSGTIAVAASGGADGGRPRPPGAGQFLYEEPGHIPDMIALLVPVAGRCQPSGRSTVGTEPWCCRDPGGRQAHATDRPRRSKPRDGPRALHHRLGTAAPDRLSAQLRAVWKTRLALTSPHVFVELVRIPLQRQSNTSPCPSHWGRDVGLYTTTIYGGRLNSWLIS